MKKIISGFLLFSLLCFGQVNKSIQCKYKIITAGFTQQELDAIKDQRVKQKVLYDFNELKNKVFYLNGTANNAIFGEVIKLPSDANKSLHNASDNELYFTDINLRNVYNWLNFFGTDYMVYYDIKQYNWTISTEFKDIDGYRCYKAKGVQKIDDVRGKIESILTAWFCPSIPFHYGPSFYYGLPGLVFEAYSENGKISYVLSSLKISNEEIIIKKPNGTEINDKTFTKIFNEGIMNIGK